MIETLHQESLIYDNFSNTYNHANEVNLQSLKSYNSSPQIKLKSLAMHIQDPKYYKAHKLELEKLEAVLKSKIITLEVNIVDAEKEKTEKSAKLKDLQESVDAINQYENLVIEYRKTQFSDLNSSISDNQKSKLNHMKFLEDLLEKKKKKLNQWAFFYTEIEKIKETIKEYQESLTILECILQEKSKLISIILNYKSKDNTEAIYDVSNIINIFLNEKKTEKLTVNTKYTSNVQQEKKKITINTLQLPSDYIESEKKKIDIGRGLKSIKNINYIQSGKNSPTIEMHSNKSNRNSRKLEFLKNNYDKYIINNQKFDNSCIRRLNLRKLSEKNHELNRFSRINYGKSIPPLFSKIK